MNRRNQQLQVRVTEAEKAAIRAAAERAGLGMSEWILRRAIPAPSEELEALVLRLQDDDSHAVWAEIIEILHRLAAVDFAAAVEGLQVEGLSPRVANYLAALVEMTAAGLGCRPPRWTRDVAPLDVPWFGTRLRGLREYLLVHAPVAFRRRNVFVDAAVGDRV